MAVLGFPETINSMAPKRSVKEMRGDESQEKATGFLTHS